MRGSTIMDLDAGPPAIDLSSAFGSTLGVLRSVGRGDLDKPTPCASWDVRALINHFIGTARWWAAQISGDDGIDGADEDYAAGDFVAAYEESIRIALGAFGAHGAMERTVKLPFGEFPGALVQGFAATDQFTHGWDLARAVGVATDLAPDLSVALLGLAELSIDDSLRGPDAEAPFGPARRAPDGSSAADRLAAFLGRAA
jgi:uncharacterized protein (TIGR03086 family)